MEDSAKAEDNLEVSRDAGNQPERFDYVVLSEAGLFKNGKQYRKGDIVQLDVATAARFLSDEVRGKDSEPIIKEVGAE